jgi:hypothetical protein
MGSWLTINADTYVPVLPLVVPLPATNFPFGYYEFASQAGVTEFFFYSSGPGMGYDPALAAYDFSIRGTLTTGEVSLSSNLLHAQGDSRVGTQNLSNEMRKWNQCLRRRHSRTSQKQ